MTNTFPMDDMTLNLTPENGHLELMLFDAEGRQLAMSDELARYAVDRVRQLYSQRGDKVEVTVSPTAEGFAGLMHRGNLLADVQYNGDGVYITPRIPGTAQFLDNLGYR